MNIPDMTTLQTATTDELIEELAARSPHLMVYREFDDGGGRHWTLQHWGCPMHSFSACQLRILPHLAFMVRGGGMGYNGQT